MSWPTPGGSTMWSTWLSGWSRRFCSFIRPSTGCLYSLRRQREFCADALAVRLTRDPLALAEALETVALLRLSSPAPPTGGTSLGGQTSSLLPRIQELIGMTPSRPRRHVWPLVALPAAALMALIATAAGSAQGRPASPSTEASAKSAPAADEQINSSKESVSRPVATEDRAPRTVTERQIAYEVRYVLRVDADSWRNLLKDRLKLVMQEADVSAWIIDDKALFDLLVLAQGDVHTNILQAPKVTAYENARANIVNRRKTKYVAGMECKRNASGAIGFIPIIKDYEVGCEIDITGRLLPHGAQLSVDLRDSSLLVLRNLLRKEWVGDRQINATYQVPTMIERRCRTSCDLFEGSSLLISLGLEERRDTLSGAAGAASHLLEAVGLPHLEPSSVTSERLVLITPRRIVLEAEERPISRPKHASRPLTPGST